MAFDPDAYLAEKSGGAAVADASSFNPDEYLKSKVSQQPPEDTAGQIKPGGLADRLLTKVLFPFGEPAGLEEKTKRDLADPNAAPTAVRPSIAAPIARAIDKVAGGTTLSDLLFSSTREATPEDQIIPEIPAQTGTGKEIAAGLANAPIRFANFALSPEGVALGEGLGLAPKAIRALTGVLFGGSEVKAAIDAPTTQETVSHLLGAAAIGAGTAVDALSGKEKTAPKPEEPPIASITSDNPTVAKANEALAALEAKPVEEIAPQSGSVETPPIQPDKISEAIPQQQPEPAAPEVVTPTTEAPAEPVIAGETVKPEAAQTAGIEDVTPEIAQSVADVKEQPDQSEMIRGMADQAREGFGPGAASAEEFPHLAEQNAREYAAIGADHLLSGNSDKASWVDAMREEYGARDATPTELNKIWRDSHDLLADFNEAQTGKELRPKRQIEETAGIRPTTAPIRDQLANSVTKAEALSEYLRGQEGGSKLGAAEKQRNLQMADRWVSADQEKVRQDLTDFVNKTLPPDERGRFVGAIGRALRRPDLVRGDPSTMYRNAFRVMQAIEGRAEDVYKGNLVDEIKGTLTKSVDAPGVDVQYRRGIKNLLDQVSLTKPSKETLRRAQSLQDYVDKERAAGREPKVPQEELDQLSVLSKLPLRNMPVNALEQLRNDVGNFVGAGRLKAKLMERAWDRGKAKSVAELSKVETTPIETRELYRPQPTEKLSVGEKFVNRVRQTLNARVNLEQAIAPMDEIYDHLDGATGEYNGWASRNIKGRLDLAFNKTQSEFQPIQEQGRQIIKANDLKKADLETIGVKGIVRMIGRDRLKEMGVRPDILDRIEKTPLSKGQQEYYDFTRKAYDQLGERVQDVAHRLYQQDMGVVKDYVPLMRDWALHADREPPAPLGDPTAGDLPFNETATMQQLRHDMNPKALSRTEQGFLRDRVAGAKTAVKVNAQEVFERHVNDALHFVHAQPELKMLGEIARTPEFEAKFGKTGQQIVLDHLDTVANQGYVNHLQRIRWIDWIRNSTSKGAVGFRLASNIVHTSQLPLAAYHAGGPQWWSKGLELAMTQKGQAWLRDNAAETFVRGGGEPAQAEVEALSKFGRAGFFVARNIDKLNSQATLLGRYAKEMQKSGVPVDSVLESPVNPELQALALRRMHRAVASPQGKDIPQMTSRGKGVGGNVSVARAINQFRNIFLDNWSNVRHDILRVGVKDGEDVIDALKQGDVAGGARQLGDAASHRAAAAFAILAGVAMETGIKLYTKKGIQAATSAVTGVQPKAQKDEETYLGDLQHHLINRIPFVGQAGTMLMYGETGVPVIDAIVNPIKETGVALLKSKKPETTAKHLVKAASGAATLLGVPGSSQAIELAEPKASQALGSVLPDRSKTRTKKSDDEFE